MQSDSHSLAGGNRARASFALLLAFSWPSMTWTADNVRLECTPRKFQVIPGEAMRLELTVRANDAASIRLHVPDDPLLAVRAIERVPMRQSEEGEVVHRRVIIWQALEPGRVQMKSLTVETKGRKLLFPEITITVRDPGP